MIPQSQQMEEDNTNCFLNPPDECDRNEEEETINESSASSADAGVNERNSSTNCVANDPPLETMRLPKDRVTGEIFFTPFDPYRHCSVSSFISASLRYPLN